MRSWREAEPKSKEERVTPDEEKGVKEMFEGRAGPGEEATEEVEAVEPNRE